MKIKILKMAYRLARIRTKRSKATLPSKLTDEEFEKIIKQCREKGISV